MSWYYIGTGGAANTFFVTDPASPSVRNSIKLHRYNNLSLAAYDSVEIDAWPSGSTSGNPAEAITVSMYNLLENWMLLPGQTWNNGVGTGTPITPFPGFAPWISPDNGLTWTKCSPLPAVSNRLYYSMKVGGYLDSNDNVIWIVGGESFGSGGDYDHRIWWSDNSGSTWNTLSSSSNVHVVGFGMRGMVTQAGTSIGAIYTADLMASSRSVAANIYPWVDNRTVGLRSVVSWNEFTTPNFPNASSFIIGSGLKWPFSGDVNFKQSGYYIGDIDPQSQKYIDDKIWIDTAIGFERSYREVCYLGNNIWFKNFGLQATGTIDSAGNPWNGRGLLSTDGGTTWVQETTNRFNGQVYSGTNQIRFK